MPKSYYDKSELQWTDSDYLCMFCHEPIYENIKTKKEICVNQLCIVSQTDPKFLRYDKTTDDMKKHEFDYWKILHGFYHFSKSFFYKKMFEKRRQFCVDYFTGKGIKIYPMLSIDFILVKLSNNEIWGNSEDETEFDTLFEKLIEEYDKIKFGEAIELGDYLLDITNTPYMMKYLEEINKIRKILGMVNAEKYGPDDVNGFYFIDRKARVGKPSSAWDFESIFKNHYGISIGFNHFFKYGYFTSLIHNYPAKSIDFAMLFSLWSECIPGNDYFCTEDELQKKFDVVKQLNKLSGQYDKFFQNYCKGDKLAPILIFDGTKFYFDYFSLWLFLFYLFPLNHSIDGTQTLSGHDTIMKQRQISAHNFEIEIRKKFRDDGFMVYPEHDDQRFEPSIDGRRHEFDCIAIDSVKKIIVLVDGKYEDVSPSSTVTENVLKHTILDKDDGSLKHAIEQHARRKFFTKNFRKIFSHLDDDFWNYVIISIVIAKHTPMIKKHLTTHLMSYEQFITINFGKEIHF